MTHRDGSDTLWPLRAAYADPPYPGYSSYYRDHPDYGGEVDHAELIAQLERDYDGWALHTYSNALRDLLPLCPPRARVAAWVKPFCSFKPGISPAYAWEPVIFVPVRNAGFPTPRDWISENITLKKGLVGAKPPAVVQWVFSLLGLRPGDQLEDLFPGTGVVGREWEAVAA
jgi:hypothetical protein